MALSPASGDVVEDGQDRQLIIVVPKNEGVAAKEDETKDENAENDYCRAG
jgi:hypothetical protein